MQLSDYKGKLMPSVEIIFEVYRTGFRGKNYRSRRLVGRSLKKKFDSEDLKAAAEFIKEAMQEYNDGKRGEVWQFKGDGKR